MMPQESRALESDFFEIRQVAVDEQDATVPTFGKGSQLVELFLSFGITGLLTD